MLAVSFLDWFLHLDTSLGAVIQTYGSFTYVLLFSLIFSEVGLIILPFLPGDSLLFAAGAFAAIGSLNVLILFLLLALAAIIGNALNYWVGRTFGLKLYQRIEGRIIKHSYLERTEAFYAKHGPRTIILARFVPIVRTIAPFVAGLGRMTDRRFMIYNMIGGTAWVAVGLAAGYFFGNLPFVKANFSLVILAVVVISFLPLLVEAF